MAQRVEHSRPCTKAGSPLQLLDLPGGQLRHIMEFLCVDDIISSATSASGIARHVDTAVLWSSLMRRDFPRSDRTSYTEPGELKAQYRRCTIYERSIAEGRLRSQRHKKQQVLDNRVARLTSQRAWLLFIPRWLYQDSWSTQQVDALGWWVFSAMAVAVLGSACAWAGSVWGGLDVCVYVARMVAAHVCLLPLLLWLSYPRYLREAGQQQIMNNLGRGNHCLRFRAAIPRQAQQWSTDAIQFWMATCFTATGMFGHLVGLWPHAPWLLQLLLLACKDLLLPLRWAAWAVLLWIAKGGLCQTDAAQKRIFFTGVLTMAAVVLAVECVLYCVWLYSGSLPSLVVTLRHAWIGLQCAMLAIVLAFTYVAFLPIFRDLMDREALWPAVQYTVNSLTSFPRLEAPPARRRSLQQVLRDLIKSFNVVFGASFVMVLCNLAMCGMHVVHATDVQLTPNLLLSPIVLIEACIRGLTDFLDSMLLVSVAVAVVAKACVAMGLSDPGAARQGWDYNASYVAPANIMLARASLCILGRHLWYEGAFSMQPAAYAWLPAEEGLQQDPLLVAIGWAAAQLANTLRIQ